MAEALRAEPATRLRAPDFYVVGHEKCGTTALHVMLSRHPQIFMSKLKETRFFAPELRSRFRRLGPGELPESLEEYLELFAEASTEQRVGEASPSYLRSRSAAARIAELRPDARIIAILREPAAYLRSFHLQAVHNHIEPQKDFAKALALEPARREGRRIPRLSQSPPALLYSEHVRYVEQLRRFEAVFAPEQILVLIYEDFRRDNEAVLRQILRFLDVEEIVAIESEETYRLQGVRSVFLLRAGLALSTARRKAAAGGPALRALNSVIPTPTRNRAVRRLWRKAIYAEQPAPDEAVMLEVRRRFRGEVEALSEHLGRDLIALWGYDKLG
jgi:Sulfotransferase domain